MQNLEQISPVTKQDLDNIKYWIKHFGGGLKSFAKEINRPYDTVLKTLNGRIPNGYIILKASEKAIKIGGEMSSKFRALRNVEKS